MEPLPLVLIVPEGGPDQELPATFSEPSPTVVASVAEFLEGEWEEWGVVVLGRGGREEDLHELLVHQLDRDPPWVILTVEEGEDGPCFRPVSMGYPLSSRGVLDVLGDPEGKGPLQELHWALRVIAKARHDLNNPLTSGLAEVQILLMDEHPPEVKESLDTIQDQFRRLRDMVADLTRLKVRKPTPPAF